MLFGWRSVRSGCPKQLVSTTTYNLLALSDVHLGSELVQHVRPNRRAARPRACAAIRIWRRCSQWYAERRVGGRPWKLVIAGDFMDFTGMSVMPEQPTSEITTAPTSEELAHGLGGAADHASAKLRLVMQHHALVMNALSAFLRAGHQLLMIPGNTMPTSTGSGCRPSSSKR
jgi:hypothetical protein